MHKDDRGHLISDWEQHPISKLLIEYCTQRKLHSEGIIMNPLRRQDATDELIRTYMYQLSAFKIANNILNYEFVPKKEETDETESI